MPVLEGIGRDQGPGPRTSRKQRGEHVEQARPPRGRRARPPGARPRPELEQIRKAVQGIRFGEVRVIIQDGLVVQIERVEKQRLR